VYAVAYFIFHRHLGDVELKPSDTIIMNQTADKTDLLVTLTLDKLQLKDAGQVKVQARNILGDVHSTAELTVNGKLDTYF